MLKPGDLVVFNRARRVSNGPGPDGINRRFDLNAFFNAGSVGIVVSKIATHVAWSASSTFCYVITQERIDWISFYFVSDGDLSVDVISVPDNCES